MYVQDALGHGRSVCIPNVCVSVETSTHTGGSVDNVSGIAVHTSSVLCIEGVIL